jgi:hypothetical protein
MKAIKQNEVTNGKLPGHYYESWNEGRFFNKKKQLEAQSSLKNLNKL